MNFYFIFFFGGGGGDNYWQKRFKSLLSSFLMKPFDLSFKPIVNGRQHFLLRKRE